MTTPTLFVLLDAAMIGGLNNYYPQSHPAWLYPLYASKDAALLGPIIIDAAAVEATQHFDEVKAMWNAFKPSLHLSLIRTTLTALELVQHLQQFTRIFDDTGTVYFLRFADCRLIPHLANALTPQQWRGLTRPMTEWQIHQRDDSRLDLPLATPDTEPNNGPWVLTTDQMDQLMAAALPDNLLDRLGYDPQTLGENTYAYWSLAHHCVNLWLQSGNGNQHVLTAFGKYMFATRGNALEQRDWATFLAHAKPQDVVKA
ncbi:DUF4123 domain-containing protein [Collimonas silvisoli]|uniref:DUF4123 domain-containing protein n=1 Tax=Collimonas silvisoli TaxID=2825884 RepID=UPI001B8D4089|nr:DUF4123 domain-containing protein [Collimonas silvisoli]